MANERYMSAAEVGELWGVSASKVRKLCGLPTSHPEHLVHARIGDKIVIRLSAAEAYVDERTTRRTTPKRTPPKISSLLTGKRYLSPDCYS